MDVWQELYQDQCKRTEAYAYAYGRLRGMLIPFKEKAEDLARVEAELIAKLARD